MLVLYFDGWFQCRLPTNPDPTDEPRGVSGFTFAVAGEPDLDRVIRLQNPPHPRSHAPEVGVAIRGVALNGERQAGHPLLGAGLRLAGEPKFESRNQLLTDDPSGTGLIEPFHLVIDGDGITIERPATLFPPDPLRPLYEVPVLFLNRRAPVDPNGYTLDPVRIARDAGIASPPAYRKERMSRLEADLSSTVDPTARAALAKRISELEKSDPSDMRTLSMILTQTRRFELDGPAEIRDTDGILSPAPDAAGAWPIEFWMGGWDADALCGFMSGRLTIPPA